ncbi:TIGR02270 family protein [Pyxidicoccus xibeiensis]|uniref:TIGR02270 family protein n=1 Tax=Pyxidicoccus xibeiensis TaxID=2906759 RepID=UPI0020A70056|nr:TIGR02270 family protein [Pyxidicoccus xibeiensis]MCP3143640.1 TIGR02270 family protein [Pyxidicoccus xibeiensis]
MPPVITYIIEQHAADVAFLWGQRQRVLTAPHYRLKDLVAFDERIQANLDGLQLAGDSGWEACAEEGANMGADPGAVFASTVLALQHRSPERFGEMLSHVDQEPMLEAAVTSALGWVPSPVVLPLARELLRAAEPLRRRIGVAAYAIQRSDPGSPLAGALGDAAPEVRARALRAVGELGRRDLLPNLNAFLQETDERCRFWAAASAVLLGDRAVALEVVEAFAVTPGPFQPRALQFALRAAGLKRARELIARLREDVTRLRMAVMAAGISGGCAELPWLLELAHVPQWGRLAAEAFSLVTGVDLELEGLAARPSQNGERHDSDQEGDVLEPDPDEHLPSPEPVKLNRWYREHEGRFAKDARCFMGMTPSIDGCFRVLRLGTQRQRIAAAINLCLLDHKAILHEWRAPAWRQE